MLKHVGIQSQSFPWGPWIVLLKLCFLFLLATVVRLATASQMSFNQQIAQYRGKVPEQHLTDLAVGHFEDSLAKTQAQVRFLEKCS